MKVFGEVTKSVRGMPRHWKAMKDVVTCDKPRIDGSNLRPGDFRMGQPNASNVVLLCTE